jgi:hypothetical protein
VTMGNLFSSSADKEIKRLTKKNTKVNRDVLHQHDEDDVSIDGDIPALKKSASLTFVRTVKGVMYDREDGQIEVVEEPLNSIGVDGDDEECEVSPDGPCVLGCILPTAIWTLIMCECTCSHT